MRSSRLPAVKTRKNFDFSLPGVYQAGQIDRPAELGFLERRENVIVLGPPGSCSIGSKF